MKKAEINEFSRLKNMNDEIIKEWKTQSYRTRIASYLILHNVSFSFSEEDGIVFTAPEFYVENMKRSLVTSFGCKKWPVIEEYK